MIHVLPVNNVPTINNSDVLSLTVLFSNDLLFKHMCIPLIQIRIIAMDAAIMAKMEHAIA